MVSSFYVQKSYHVGMERWLSSSEPRLPNHPYDNLQLSITSVSGYLIHSLTFISIWHAPGTYTYTQAHTHTFPLSNYSSTNF